MRVYSSHTGELSAAAAAVKTSAATAHKKSDGTAFSSALKDANTTADAAAAKAPSTEKTTPVAGHAYADIVAGPRSGMFINTSTNARKGEVFVLVKKNNREYHIYGTGKDRHVIGLAPKTDATPATTPTPATTDPTSTGTPSTGTSTVGS
jgi:hypothetical protein